MTIDVSFPETKPILLTIPPFPQSELVASLAEPKSKLTSPLAQSKPILPTALAQTEAELLLPAFAESEAKLPIPFAETKGVTPFYGTKLLLRELTILIILG